MKRFALSCALLAACTAPAFASATPEEPGKTFVAVGYSYFDSASFFNASGIVRGSNCAFQKNAVTVYAERGIDERDTVSLNTEFDKVSNGNATGQSCPSIGTQSALGDVELGLTHRMSHQGSRNFGYEFIAIVPGTYSANVIPPLNYGRPGAQASLVYGGSFKLLGTYGFYDTDVGIRAYTSYPAPQLRTDATVGIDLTKHVQLLGTYYGLDGLGAGGVAPAVAGTNPLTVPSYASVQLGSELRVRFTEAASLIFGISNFVAGRNVGTGHTVNAGAWLRF